MDSGERSKGGGSSRAARLEAELRANLKKRKAQAKARAQGRESDAAAGCVEGRREKAGD